MNAAVDLTNALGYAEKYGWCIFPTRLIRRPNGRVDKQPCIKDWPNIASRDPAQICKWWKIWSDAVPSIVTGPKNGIIVLDIDVKKNGDGEITRNGFDTLEELGWWCLPPTPIVHTPSGGVHLYFRAPASKIRNSTGRYGLGPNVDVRGYNGQAVLPSANSDYWVDPHYNFDTVVMMTAPDWFDHRQPKQYDHSRNPSHRIDPRLTLAEACRRIRTAPEGTRHDTYRHETFRIARLVGFGLINERAARYELEAEIMALGMAVDSHTGRVEKYYALAFAEGLAAARGAHR